MKKLACRLPNTAEVCGLLWFAFVLTASPAAFARVPAQTSQSSAPPVIDNERVMVQDIALKPGEAGSMERHATDFVTVFLVGGKIRTTGADGKSTVALRQTGDAVFGRKGTEEKMEVVSGAPARLVVVNLKDHPVPPLENKSGYPAAFPRPGAKKVLDNNRVTVWNYAWTKGVPTPMHYHDKDVVVIYRGHGGSVKSTTPDGQSAVNSFPFGTIRFNTRDRTHFEELVAGEQSAIMVELK